MAAAEGSADIGLGRLFVQGQAREGSASEPRKGEIFPLSPLLGIVYSASNPSLVTILFFVGLTCVRLTAALLEPVADDDWSFPRLSSNSWEKTEQTIIEAATYVLRYPASHSLYSDKACTSLIARMVLFRNFEDIACLPHRQRRRTFVAVAEEIYYSSTYVMSVGAKVNTSGVKVKFALVFCRAWYPV